MEEMLTVAFFVAFLASVWLLALPLYWLIAPHGDREGARQKLAWYRNKPIWPYGILKVVFIAANAWALFPVEGTLLSIAVIALFRLL